MLKRYQVLLEDWQEEYLKMVAKKYHLGFSAIIRTELSLAIIIIAETLFTKEYKSDVTVKKMLKGLLKFSRSSYKNKRLVTNFISKLSFEGRKAAEFRLAKEKKK